MGFVVESVDHSIRPIARTTSEENDNFRIEILDITLVYHRWKQRYRQKKGSHKWLPFSSTMVVSGLSDNFISR